MAILLSFFLIVPIIAVFFDLHIAVYIISGVMLFVLIMYISAKKGIRYIDELSDEANKMLARFPAFYRAPFAGKAYSGLCSGINLTCIVILAVGWYKYGLMDNLLYFIPLVVIFFVAGILSKQFNPTKFLDDISEREAHEEIIYFLMRNDGPYKK